jgi:transposase
MSNFRPIDRETGFLLPPSVDEWLPKTHLARFVVEVIDGLDLSAMTKSYRGSGSASYHPSVLLGIVVYGYATGVFSSRKLERATYDSVAVRFLAANQHPDHDTIATFRRRFLAQIEGLFVQVLLLAREMGMLKLGTVALDGTKIHANASRHSALSYEHATKIEAQLKAEVAELLAKAEAADRAGIPDGLSIPEELARREERLRKLAEARAKINARAKERFAREQADYQAKLAARDAKAAASGKKSAGRPPQPPVETPLPTDQINLTDEASRIMPVAGGGFEQCYNAQAVVAAGSLLVVAADVVQAANDKQQLAPMLGKIDTLPVELGRPETLLADSGYFSAANVTFCQAAEIEPLIAAGRQHHHPSLHERFAAAGPAPDHPTLVEAMAHRLQTPEGKKLYALRKQTPEPVFGIIKSVLGFRQFLLRGLNAVRGEWSLVTLAWNMKRMFTLSLAR